MGVDFPYPQEDHFAFDRIMEIVHIAIHAYGENNVFPGEDKTRKNIIMGWPLYSAERGTMSDYSSVDPDAGARAWNALGLPAKPIRDSLFPPEIKTQVKSKEKKKL